MVSMYLSLTPLVVSFLLSVAIIWSYTRQSSLSFSKRDIFLATVIFHGTLVVIQIEFFSLVKAIDWIALFAFWIVLSLSLAVWIGIRVYRVKSTINFHFSWSKKPLWVFISGIVLVLQLGILSVIAYKAPPNNWDSMTYHLGRIVHWEQQKSIVDYATNIQRQIFLPPFAEYNMLLLQVLTGGDHLVNFVQWFSMIVSLVGVSLIARELGGNASVQFTSAIITASIPMGILQSTSTQTDYVVSAGLVCFIYFGYRFIRDPNSIWLAVLTGSSLGLALLTKNTAYIYGLPFCILIGISVLIRKIGQISLKWKNLILITFIVIGLNSGFILRNLSIYHNFFGPDFGIPNQIISFPAFASIAIRNIAFHIPTNSGISWIDIIGNGVMSGLAKMHQLTGLSPIDPKTSLTNRDIFLNPIGISKDEDLAGNPIHLVLILLSLIVIPFFVRQRKAILYLIGWITGFILFSLFLKWQTWGSRLELPLFVVASPLISMALFKLNKKILIALSFTTLVVSFLWVTENSTRPLASVWGYSEKNRSDYYFSHKPDLLPEFNAIADQISKSGCSQLGLIIGEDDWEYPLWMIFRDRHYNIRIEHIQVTNPTQKLMDPNFKPCAIVSTQGVRDRPGFQLVYKASYQLYLADNAMPIK